MFTKGAWYLLIPLGIDLVLLALLKLLQNVIQKR
jgi:hypothetical protein